MWPFTNKPRDTEAVEKSKEERDEAMADLDAATKEVDRVYDRIIADYEAAEEERLK